ncbi:MAG TPA: 50S ribosomal protein L37e [Methanomicrobiales archaeon]|nr:50S ribosomal protein L37e [Methanomicrobiales archaeon]
MSKGTPSRGKRQHKVHIACRRCGHISFHVRHKTCSSCGFGRSARFRGYRWVNKKPKIPTH